MAEPQLKPVDKETEPKKQAPAIGKASPSENPIVNLIEGGIEKTVQLTAVDPESFYNPYNSDELYQKNGNYSVYEDMMKDDQVAVAIAIKKDLVIGSGWHIACEDEEGEEIKQDLELALTEDLEVSFDDCLSDMLSAYEIGFSVSEKQFKTRDDGTLTLKNIKTRNPVSWLFHQDQFGNVTRYEQQGATKEFSNIDPNSIIHFVNAPRYGKPYGTSDLRSAYAAYFIKKQIIRYYAIFLEKAASPTPVAKYDRGMAETAEIEKIHNTIKKLQSSSAMTIPKDFEVEFLQVTGNGEAYIKGINLFNMFIGRALFVPDLLGFQGGETTGGAQALGREQMVIFFKHVMRRRRSLENLINHHIIKPLVLWNHGEQEHYPKFKLNPIEEEQAEANATLWLEAVKSKAFKPTLEEINHFKRIVDFPETSEEEWAEQEADAIEQAAHAAALLEEGGEGEDGNPKDAKSNDDGNPEDAEKPKLGAKKPKEGEDRFAKTYNIPIGDYHKKTDFKAIEKQLDSNLDLFAAKATPIVKEIFAKFAIKLSNFAIGKAVKLEKLENIALPKPELKRLEKLLDASFKETFQRSMEMAQGEIFKSNFAVQPAPEFLKTLEEEDYNFIKDWEYQTTKKVRADIIAAVKDGKPISAVIDTLGAEVTGEAYVALERYARTKFTEVMNKGRLEYFKDTGVIGAYQYSAVLDSQTSDICAGLHGKVFKAGSEPVPPMHFNCRSLLIPITNFEEWESDDKVGRQDINDFIEENKGKGFARG